METKAETKVETKKNKENKRPPKKGPVRFEFIIPIMIIILITGLYAKFYLNIHVKKLLEWSGETIHGAEVNIGSVGIHFLEGKFNISELQITDKKNPEVNVLSIQKMKFAFSWDALLRAKIVIDESSILGIGLGTKRKKRGKIFPQKERSEIIVALETTGLQIAKDEFKNNVLGDIAGILAGSDVKNQLDQLRHELKSENKIKELEAELKLKESEWKKRLDTIGNKQELKELESKLKNYKFNKKNPVKSVKEVGEISKNIQNKVKEVGEGIKSLKNEINYFETNLKNVPELVKQDIKDIEGHFKIPTIDFKDMSMMLLMGYLKSYGGISEGEVRKYVTLAEEYMPAPKNKNKNKNNKDSKSDNSSNKIIPRKRGQGQNYKFPITVSYPSFWLKLAEISSNPNEDGSQTSELALKGKLTNLTNEPAVVKAAAVLELQGEFKEKKLKDMLIKVIVDHTTHNPFQEFIMEIGRFPVGELVFSDTSSLKFSLSKSHGKASIRGKHSENGVTLETQANLKNYTSQIEAPNKHVTDILRGVMGGIKEINITSKTQGEFGNLKTHISSNLGDDLGRGIKREVENKIKEAKDKVKLLVENRIKEKMGKLHGDYDKVKGLINKNLDKEQNEIDSLSKNALNNLDKEKNERASEVKTKTQEKTKEKTKDLLKGLKKKIKF